MAMPMPVIVAQGDGIVLRLGAEEIGWVSRGHIGFRGFDCEAEAMWAAVAAGRALARMLHLSNYPEGAPRLVRDDRGDHVLVGGDELAELERPAPDVPPPGGYGFVLPLPEGLAPALQARTALAVFRALLAWEPASAPAPRD